MLKPLTEYKNPTKKQTVIIAKLLSINAALVPIVVPTQKAAKPLIQLASDIIKIQDIENYVKKNGFSQSWLKMKLGNSIIVGKGRWNRLVNYLKNS